MYYCPTAVIHNTLLCPCSRVTQKTQDRWYYNTWHHTYLLCQRRAKKVFHVYDTPTDPSWNRVDVGRPCSICTAIFFGHIFAALVTKTYSIETQETKKGAEYNTSCFRDGPPAGSKHTQEGQTLFFSDRHALSLTKNE